MSIKTMDDLNKVIEDLTAEITTLKQAQLQPPPNGDNDNDGNQQDKKPPVRTEEELNDIGKMLGLK